MHTFLALVATAVALPCASAQSCIVEWGQCGGQGFVTTQTCCAGLVCEGTEWWQSCKKPTGTTTTTSVVPTTTTVATTTTTTTTTSKPVTTTTSAKPITTTSSSVTTTRTTTATVTTTKTTTTTKPTTTTTTKPPTTTTTTTKPTTTTTKTTSIPSSTCPSDQPAITNQALLDRIKFQTRTLPGTPTIDLANPANNPPNVQRVMRILPESSFNYLFPRRNEVYTYLGLLKAIAKWPAFCDDAFDATKKDEVCRKELASSFAHFVQETGENSPWTEQTMGYALWRQGLYYIREIGQGPYRDQCDDTTWWGKYYPCSTSASYYGRGAKQLTYMYNYGPFSDVVFGDRTVLLNNPDLVATDGFLAFASAIWFGMTPQSPKPSMHDINSGWYQPGALEASLNIIPGFGATINVINGGLECGQGGATESQQVQNRVAAYRNFAAYLNVPYTEAELGCRNMKPFPSNGVAALDLYWDRDWAWQTCRCKQVTYQTPFNMLTPSLGYNQCTCNFFDVNCNKRI